MEGAGTGLLGRVAERVLGWVALGLLILLGVAIYQTPADTKQAIWSAVWRSVVWLLIVTAVPWSARLFVRRLMELGTNWAGVALIAGFTLIDAVAGIMLMTAWPPGVWTWLAAVGVVGLAGSYNYLVAEYLAERCGV